MSLWGVVSDDMTGCCNPQLFVYESHLKNASTSLFMITAMLVAILTTSISCYRRNQTKHNLSQQPHTHTHSKEEAHIITYAPRGYSDHLCSAEYSRHESHGVRELVRPKGL